MTTRGAHFDAYIEISFFTCPWASKYNSRPKLLTKADYNTNYTIRVMTSQCKKWLTSFVDQSGKRVLTVCCLKVIVNLSCALQRLRGMLVR